MGGQMVAGQQKNQRIAALVSSVIENSKETIAMDSGTQRAFLQLQQFLFEAVYTNPVAKSEETKAENVVKACMHILLTTGKTPNRVSECMGAGRNPHGGVRLYFRYERPVCHSSLH